MSQGGAIMRARSAFLASALLLGLGAAAVEAIEQKPLPAFNVLGADGTAVSSSQLPVSNQWLLIYVVPGCRSCDLLLRALKSWQSAQLLQQTIIVVGAPTAAAAQQYIQGVLPPDVGAVQWYADVQAEAWTALQLTGTPVLVGVRKGTIQWAISGVLNDPGALESVVKTWVGQ
jgi:hypothetical protein